MSRWEDRAWRVLFLLLNVAALVGLRAEIHRETCRPRIVIEQVQAPAPTEREAEVPR